MDRGRYTRHAPRAPHVCLYTFCLAPFHGPSALTSAITECVHVFTLWYYYYYYFSVRLTRGIWWMHYLVERLSTIDKDGCFYRHWRHLSCVQYRLISRSIVNTYEGNSDITDNNG